MSAVLTICVDTLGGKFTITELKHNVQQALEDKFPGIDGIAVSVSYTTELKPLNDQEVFRVAEKLKEIYHLSAMISDTYEDYKPGGVFEEIDTCWSDITRTIILPALGVPNVNDPNIYFSDESDESENISLKAFSGEARIDNAMWRMLKQVLDEYLVEYKVLGDYHWVDEARGAKIRYDALKYITPII